MAKPRPLPLSLPEVFSVMEALDAGVARSRLSRSDLRAPHRGVRAPVGRPEPDSLRARCLEYAPRLRPWQFLSHGTALVLCGAPAPEWPWEEGIHVSAHRPRREPRMPGIHGHRLQAREAATVVLASGLPVEHPVRAWRQAGTVWSADALIAAADFLVSPPYEAGVSGQRSADAPPLASVAELRAEVDRMGDVRRGILTRALRDVRVGVRSARETALRLVLQRAGLPEPDLNWTLRDERGRFVAELDLAYPRWRVGAEYDGRVHADDPQQFAKDADRWDRIRDAGWAHERVLNHHMARGGVLAVRKVRDALIRAGWRPGA